jgi:nucleotide-binding universal stress UspA family protein
MAVAASMARKEVHQMKHSIICGVDGSQPSRSAARVAARLANTLDLRLVLAHATEDRPTFPYRDARVGELQRRRLIDDGRRMLEGTAAELPTVVPDTRVVLGCPVEALGALCREEAAELSIVGSRGRGPLAAALLGSVSARLASTAECPVLVVSAPEAAERFLALEPSGGSIVCGVDGSAESERALQVAVGLAERMRLELLPLYIDDGTWEDAAAVESAHVHVELGEPVDGLRWRALSDDARLIVVGSRGHGAVRAAVLGSVSGALAATAPLPVLVVPPTARFTGSAAHAAAGSTANLLRRPRLDRPKEPPMNEQAATTPTVEPQHVGRFSQGIEQLPPTPDLGRFSEGIEQLPNAPDKLRTGRFSDGIEQLPQTPSKLRRGTFGDRYAAIR